MRRIFSMLTVVALMVACGPAETEATQDEGTMENTEMGTDEGTSDDMGNEASTETTDNLTQGQEVTINLKAIGETMNEMAYEPAKLEVAAGSVVTLVLENTAKSEAMIHNVVIIKPGKQTEIAEAAMEVGAAADFVPENDNIIAATAMAKPGETVEVKFNAPAKAGTYQFICTYPGHTAMKGVFLVK